MLALVVLSAAILAAGLLAASAGPAGASDNPAVFQVEPQTTNATPGESVEIAVVLSSHGGYDGSGIASLSFGLDYDPSLLRGR